MRTTRCVGAVGFIVVRWLSAVCNVPALCDWLAVGSWLLAAALAVAWLRASPHSGYAVLGRRGSRLLFLTGILNLLGIPLVSLGAEPSGWQAAAATGLDLLAWAWVLYGAVAGARWLWGRGAGSPAAEVPRFAPRHLLLSALIVSVLAVQVAALFKERPTWWPFIDYPLYGSAHGVPIRALHHRLYRVTDDEPPALLEITADALGMSWFVYHTQLLPRIFDQPWGSHAQFERALLASDLPPFTSLVAEATWFLLEDGELKEFPELRPLAFAPTAGQARPAVRDRAAPPVARDDVP